jgi:hypothetical protein
LRGQIINGRCPFTLVQDSDKIAVYRADRTHSLIMGADLEMSPHAVCVVRTPSAVVLRLFRHTSFLVDKVKLVPNILRHR